MADTPFARGFNQGQMLGIHHVGRQEIVIKARHIRRHLLQQGQHAIMDVQRREEYERDLMDEEQKKPTEDLPNNMLERHLHC